jgi:transposase
MLARALGVEGAVVEDVRFEGDDAFVLRVRARREHRRRCPRCLARCPGYDAGDGVRRWRARDLGLMRAYVEASAPRVRCAEHGVLVSHAPWARHGSGFTKSFEDTVAWLAVRTDKTSLASLLRIAWRSVGAILERVSAEMRTLRDPFEGVTRIGIDEVSYRKGHRYLTVVVDHDTGRLLWAQPGHDEKTLRKFFRLLGKERRAAIELVSADAAPWIASVVHEQCPDAALCMDPFHVVAWATEAVNKVRRGMWGELRRRGEMDKAATLKGSRWALAKNPEDLTRKQRTKLRAIEHDNRRLYRAYLLKEQLREIFKTKGYEAVFMIDEWLAWASRSKLEPFVRVARAIRRHRDAIDCALAHGLSNARVEGVNTKLKLLTRLAYGFHSHAPLVALAMIKLGGMCPPLPSLE